MSVRISFILFVLLILGGIITKRVFGHREYMILFHLPAAVFLALSAAALKRRRQAEYDAEIAQVRGNPGPGD